MQGPALLYYSAVTAWVEHTPMVLLEPGSFSVQVSPASLARLCLPVGRCFTLTALPMSLVLQKASTHHPCPCFKFLLTRPVPQMYTGAANARTAFNADHVQWHPLPQCG